MFARARKILITLHQDESGAMAVEKVLLLALIALPIIIVLAIFKTTIIGWFKGWSSSLENQQSQGQQQGQ